MENVAQGMRAFLNDKTMWYFFDEQCPQCGAQLRSPLDHDENGNPQPHGDPACPFCGYVDADLNHTDTHRLNQARQEMKFEQANNFLTNTSIVADRSIFKHSFNSFVAAPNSPQEAVEAKATSLADRIGQHQVTHTFFYGQTGTGKTHLAVATVFEALKVSHYELKATIINCPALIQQAHGAIHASTQDHQTFDHKLSTIKKECNLLVLDDLGAEAGNQLSEYDLRLMTDLIDHFENRSMIITTNKQGKELSRLYGRRIMSRLINHTHEGVNSWYNSFANIPDYRASNH